MPGLTSYRSGYDYALNHPLFTTLDDTTLKESIKIFDDMADAIDCDNAAGIADAIRVILINRTKVVAV